MIDSGGFMKRHGDIALLQHESSRRCFRACWSEPNQAGGASEPAGRSDPRTVDDLTAAANQAAENLARMLDEHLMLPERRQAQDGRLYTEEEFRDWYGEDSARRWEQQSDQRSTSG